MQHARSLSSKMVVPYLTDYRGYGYYNFYFFSNLPVLLLSNALLLRVHSLIERNRPWLTWLGLGAGFAALAYFWLGQAISGGRFTRITSLILFFQLALCTVIAVQLILRRHEVSLGRNWDAIYLGLAIPTVFFALNSAAFLFERWWPYARYLQPIEPLSWISWGIIALGLRRLDLPRTAQTGLTFGQPQEGG